MERFNSYLDLIDMTHVHAFCMEHGSLTVYQRGEKFVQEGEVGKHFGYVASGYFKYATLRSSGEEAVCGFAFAGEYVTDFYNSCSGAPSEVSIIAGRTSEVYRVPISAFKKLISCKEAMLEQAMLGALYRTIYKRYVQIYRYSTEERYNLLLAEHPEIFDIVSLKDIASILMVSPVHLSRMRRKMSGNPGL